MIEDCFAVHGRSIARAAANINVRLYSDAFVGQPLLAVPEGVTHSNASQTNSRIVQRQDRLCSRERTAPAIQLNNGCTGSPRHVFRDSQEWLSYIESVTIRLLHRWTTTFGICPTGTPVAERFPLPGDFTVLYLPTSLPSFKGSVARRLARISSRLIGLWTKLARGLFG